MRCAAAASQTVFRAMAACWKSCSSFGPARLPDVLLGLVEASHRDGVRPGGSIGLDQGSELVWRVAERVGASCLEPSGKLRVLDRAADLAGDLIDDLTRRVGGRHQAVPG